MHFEPILFASRSAGRDRKGQPGHTFSVFSVFYHEL